MRLFKPYVTYILIAVLLMTLLFGEVHSWIFADEIQLKNWFLFSGKSQCVYLYFNDTAQKLTWVIFLWVWYMRERKRGDTFSSMVLFFWFYRVMDLVGYWVNNNKLPLSYTALGFGIFLAIILSITTHDGTTGKTGDGQA